MLRLFNKIWDSGQIPKHWKHAFVIPILKPGKNKFDSYRPISLLNTMCKILEKIIDTRLRWFLEKTNYLSPHQNGFCKNKSTYNNLHDIQNDIIKTFETKQVLDLVSLDLAKAYDNTWRPRIIQKLHKILCEGNMLNFIKNFYGTEPSRSKSTATLLRYSNKKMVCLRAPLYPSHYFWLQSTTLVKKSNSL